MHLISQNLLEHPDFCNVIQQSLQSNLIQNGSEYEAKQKKKQSLSTYLYIPVLLYWWLRRWVINCWIWDRLQLASIFTIWSCRWFLFNGLFQEPIHDTCSQCEDHLLVYLKWCLIMLKIEKKKKIKFQLCIIGDDSDWFMFLGN